jgi:hypothetical protein
MSKDDNTSKRLHTLALQMDVTIALPDKCKNIAKAIVNFVMVLLYIPSHDHRAGMLNPERFTTIEYSS